MIKTHQTRTNADNKKQSISGFAILENALRISYIIIKIAIAVIVPAGKHIYDPGVLLD